MHRVRIAISIACFVAVVAACSSGRAEPTPTSAPAADTPIATTAPTPTPTAASAPIQPAPTVPIEEPAVESAVVTFWTTDNEPDRIATYQAVAERFMAANPGVQVEIVPLDESSSYAEIVDAVAAGQAPDLVRIGAELVPPLLADNLLDTDAAGAVIAAVGEDDFRAGPLRMVTDPESGVYVAVPYDGWIQALWYRRDLFDQQGLNPPVAWQDIDAACDALPGLLPYGIVIGTDPNQNYVQQLFEQVAMSNNAWPFDADGNVTMNTPEMIEALRFYTGLKRCAPDGVLNLFDAREAYEGDQAGMLFYSTYIMDDLVQGSDARDGGKVEIAVDDLAGKTGFAAGIVGPNGSASYGQLVVLGILQDADPAAQAVAEFLLVDGYEEILSLAPFGKVPVLESALETWTSLSPVFERYSPATLGHIANGYAVMQRWLFRPEYDRVRRTVIGDIESRLLIPQAVHSIVSGVRTPESAAEWLQTQVEELLAARLQ